jgi:hypothetical protein
MIKEKKLKETNGSRNRNAGHSWELEVADLFRKAGFPHVVTSRSDNRHRDAEKVDLVNRNEVKTGRLPYNIQCKNCVGKLAYQKLLSELPKEDGIINVLLHKQTEKANTRFITRDKFAIMYQNDFMTMVNNLDRFKKGFELLNNYFDSIADEEKSKVNAALKLLGL